MSTDPQFPLPVPDYRGASRTSADEFEQFRHDLFNATPRVFVTQLIIAVNCVVFGLMVLSRPHSLLAPTELQMIRWGAGYGPLTLHGQPWRLFTEMFLHFGIIHIGMNMYVLWQGGPLIERLFGNFPYLVIYIFSGLCGSFLSLHAHPLAISAGASGAVFGVYGALLGFLAVRRLNLPRQFFKSLTNSVGLFVIYNLAFGFYMKGIDMFAHGGGLLSGFILGAILSRSLVAGENRTRAMIVAVACTIATLYLFAHLSLIANISSASLSS